MVAYGVTTDRLGVRRMAYAMANMRLFNETKKRITYVDSNRMLEYDFVEKTVTILGTSEDVENLSREYGIIFESPDSTSKPQKKPPEPENPKLTFFEKIQAMLRNEVG